jgi:hypothetical protein
MIPSGPFGQGVEFSLEPGESSAGALERIDEMSAEFPWYFTMPENAREDCHYYNAATCPDCGQGMIRQGGCFHCPGCGFSSCGF